VESNGYKRSLVSDIQYQESSYLFIYAGDETEKGTGLIILDSHFENLLNLQIFTIQAKVIVQRSVFDNIEVNVGAFLTLSVNTIPEKNLQVANTTIT